MTISMLIFIRLPLYVGNFPLGHVIFPFLLWLALRFSPREVASVSLITSTIAVIGTVNGTGPFSRPDNDINLILLTTFVVSIMITALIISVIMTQHNKARAALQQSHDMLEERVNERTQELSQTNKRLYQEISEREEAQAELAAARDQALAAVEFKNRIISNVSHEARTPISVIKLYSQLMIRGKYGSLTDEQSGTLDLIVMNSNDLTRFVDNLLESARLGSKHSIPIHYEDIVIQDWLTKRLQIFNHMLEGKDIKLDIEFAKEMPTTISIDNNSLEFILYNLITNAIKFTEQGRILIYIKQSKENWVLLVSDTGIGIHEENQSKIFDPFWQVDSSATRRATRGVGLGLSIVKQYVERLDGRISLKSELGSGSSFEVYVPLNPQG
jgi:signal transduction histidine kinase